MLNADFFRRGHMKGDAAMSIDRRRQSPNYFPLRDAIDRLFESSFIAPQGFSGEMGMPSASVRTTDDDVVVELAVPGAKPDDIHISVTGETVSITGEIKREQHDQRGQTYIDEMYQGQFQRSFTLPFPVDADKANAGFENGILKLTLPKSEAAKPRRIQVNQQSAIRGSSGQQTQSDVQKETVPVNKNSSSS
jgi:HSP20 family protein